MATEGKNVAAAIFWMKVRAGWREKQAVANSTSPYAVISGGYPADELTDEELLRIARGGESEGRRTLGHNTPSARYAIDTPPDLTAVEWERRFKPRP
jgi:hypothetical protein